MKKIIFLFFLFPLVVFPADYYVSPNGNDARDGLSADTAWQTAAKVSADLPSGSRLFLDGGSGIFRGEFNITAGEEGNRVSVSSYNGTARIYGSYDKTNTNNWTEESPNIWVCGIGASGYGNELLSNPSFGENIDTPYQEGDLLPNSSFVTDTSSWYFYSINGSVGVRDIANYDTEPAAYTITTGETSASAYSTQLYTFSATHPIVVYANKKYRLSFYCNSTSDFQADVTLTNYAGGYTVSNTQKVNISYSQTLYTVDFVTLADSPNARITLAIGKAPTSTTLTFDTFSFIDTHELPVTDSNWHFYAKSDVNAIGGLDSIIYNSSPASYKIDFGSNVGSSLAAVQFYTYPIIIKGNHAYRLSFSLFSSAETQFYITTQLTGYKPPYTNYGGGYKYTLVSPGWNNYSIVLTSDQDATDARITFYLGKNTPAGTTLRFDTLSFRQDETIDPLSKDVGNIVFNNGLSFLGGGCGVKKQSELGLLSQGDFFYSFAQNVLKLYSVGNPGSIYTDIECVMKRSGIKANRYVDVSNVEIYNCGLMGISLSGDNHINNVYFEYIGGCDQYDDYTVRLGNAIQLYGSGSNILVENCYAKDIYDAAYTNQQASGVESNIIWRNNISVNSEYGMEFFSSSASSIFRDIYVYNNTLINSGSGWSHAQRWNGGNGSSLRIGSLAGSVNNFVIKNNIFEKATEHNVVFTRLADISKVIMDYNFYNADIMTVQVNTPTPIATYITLTDWAVFSGQEAHSLSGDALVNVDGTLSSYSPCIDSGVNLPSITTDYFGNNRRIGSGQDIGASEYYNVKYSGTVEQ